MPRLRKPNPVPECPLTAAVAAIGGKWKLILIYHLSQSPQHFAALRRLAPGISQKVLTDQLRELEDDGIAERRRTGTAPAPVIYSLSAYGRSLLPVLESVLDWGRTHLARRTTGPDQLRAGSSSARETRTPEVASTAGENHV
jgi:DNA-binding HxlR family transcriptional regulator